MLCFSEMGIPWSGPRSRGPLRPPGAKSSDSAFLACARATSVVMVMYALSLGLIRSMRASMSLVSSTGESLRLRKSFPISSMDANATSESLMGVSLNHGRRDSGQNPVLHKPRLEDSFLMTEISEGADVRDDKRQAELILLAHLAEVDATVLEGQAAAAAIVTELHDLALQCLVLEVVAETGDEIQAFAGFASVADEPANLV